MFSDPQSVTLNSVAQSLPKIEVGARKGVYRKSDSTLQLTISHTPAQKRVRSMYRLDQFAVVTDPISNENDQEFAGAYLVIDRPNFGFSQTQIEQLVACLTAAVNTAGVVGKLFAGES